MTVKEIDYGFEWGPLKVERSVSDDKAGWAILEVITHKKTIQVYVTKTGKIRVFDIYGDEWKTGGKVK